MADHEVDFTNGHLFCLKSQEGDENDMLETFDVFERMEKYYNSYCIVKHWKQYTMESGGFIETRMRVKDAVWQIKEGWLEQASFILERHNVELSGCEAVCSFHVKRLVN